MSQSLQASLEQQVENLTQLASLLEQELHLISSRDAESLMALLNSKTALLDTIQNLDTAISDQYAKLKTDGDVPESIQNLIADAKEQLAQCQYRTQINQTAVEQGQLRLTHLRNLMLEVRAKESLTYDKSGKPKGPTLGKGISA